MTHRFWNLELFLSNSQTHNPSAMSMSIEDSVRSEPGVAFSQCIGPVLDFSWNHLLQRLIDTRKLVAYYVGLAAFYFGLADDLRFWKTAIIMIGILPFLVFFLLLSVVINKFVRHRHPALSTAQDLLLERIQCGRAKRTSTCDIYFPASTKTSKSIGLLFYPGALVNHTAYSSIAASLSDEGILVVVLSLEPVRFVCNLSTAREMTLQALKAVPTEWDTKEWVLAGHSAGATLALNLAVENDAHPINTRISKVVVCGAGRNEIGSGGSLRGNATPFRALVVNGSEDNLVKSVGEKDHNEFVNHLLPPNEDQEGDESLGSTRFVTIEGGNHSQFADYPGSFMDGVASIPANQQQRLFVETTCKFLLS